MELAGRTLRWWIFWMPDQTLLLSRFSYSLSISNHFTNGTSIVDHQSMFAASYLGTDSFARSNSVIKAWGFHHFQLFSWNIRRGALYRFEGAFIYFSIVAWNVDLFILAGVQLLIIHVNILSRSSIWNSIGWAEIARILRLLLFGCVAAGRSLHFTSRLLANLNLFINSDFCWHQSPLSIWFHLIWLLQQYILVFKHHVTVLVFFLKDYELSIRFRIFVQNLILELHFTTSRSGHLSVVLLAVTLQNPTLGWLWPYLPLLYGVLWLSVA